MHAMSLKANWIKRWFDVDNLGKWKLFVHQTFSMGNGLNIFECAVDSDVIANLEIDIFGKKCSRHGKNYNHIQQTQQ